MRRVRIFEHTSLDGVISPGEPGEYSDGYAQGGWTAPYRSPVGLAAVLEAQAGSFDLLLGRRTYDLWAAFWPNAGRSPMADRLNAATKHVATHRPESLGWGPIGRLSADVMDGVRRLKSTDGPVLIVWGSATLTSALLGQGLVDEVLLFVYPVLLGRGNRCLSETVGPRELTLVRTKTTTTGVLVNTYRDVGVLRTEEASPRERDTQAADIRGVGTRRRSPGGWTPEPISAPRGAAQFTR